MRRLICIVSIVVLFISAVSAQKVENFQGVSGSWGWETFDGRRNSAIIQDGQMVMSAQRSINYCLFFCLIRIPIRQVPPTMITTQFPVDVSRDFTVRTEFLLPRLRADIPFGMIFDETGADGILIVRGNRRNQSRVTLFSHGTRYHHAITYRLPNRNAMFTMDVLNRDGSLSIDINGVTAFMGVNHRFTTPTMGFMVAGGRMRVQEVVIHQLPTEEED